MKVRLPVGQEKTERPPREVTPDGTETVKFEVSENRWEDPLAPTPIGDCWFYEIPYIFERYTLRYTVTYDASGQGILTEVINSKVILLRVVYHVVFKVCPEPRGTEFTGYLARVEIIGNELLIPDELVDFMDDQRRSPDLPPPGDPAPPSPTFSPKPIPVAQGTQWVSVDGNIVFSSCASMWRPIGPTVIHGCTVSVLYQMFDVCQAIDLETGQPAGGVVVTAWDPVQTGTFWWPIKPCG